MIDIPLAVRPTGEDVDESFFGADVLRALSRALSSAESASYRLQRTAHVVATGQPSPLASGFALLSTKCGTTLDLPLRLRCGTIEGALGYTKQPEVRMVIASSNHSASVNGSATRWECVNDSVGTWR